MIKKIIFINYQPLTEKVKKDFYISDLLQKDYKVEYWNLSKIYFPNIFLNSITEDYIFDLTSFKELERMIAFNRMPETLFISIITYEYRVIRLFLLLSKYNCKVGFFARGALPFLSIDSTIFKLKKVLNPKLLLGFIKNKFAFFLKKFGVVKHYDLVFNAGNYGITTIGQCYKIEIENAKVISINSFDYDNYNLTLENDILINERYCLFLDDYLPYHPDFELFGINTIESKSYYDSLNIFFNSIEKKFNLEVVVAAHPKAEKYKSVDLFNGRKVKFDKTSELTKYAEFTIAHCSTAISYSVLNLKPVLFLYTNSLQMIMPSHFHLILNYSKVLDSLILNIDKYSIDDVEINTVNVSKYSDFKYKYLTSKESENFKTSEIFFNELSRI